MTTKITDKFYDPMACGSWDVCLWLAYKYEDGSQIDVWNVASGKRKINQYNNNKELTHTAFIDRGTHGEVWDNLDKGMLLSEMTTDDLKVIKVNNDYKDIQTPLNKKIFKGSDLVYTFKK